MDAATASVPAIAEEPECAHDDHDSDDYVLGESPYGISAIQEEDEHEHAHDDDGLSHSPVPSNLRPLVTPSGDTSDWMECANADGDVFYYNVVTTATQWERPFQETPLERPHSEGAGAHHLLQRVLDGTLRRLDPHTQLQLEEARRRHAELEELRDEEVRMGGEHWVEMYDPTHDGFYYYGIHSGDLRWDRPESYVMKVESDDILRMVVRLQCAFRMKLARRRVLQMKLQRSDGVIVNPWVEVYDPFHKVLYYYCSSTGETRWDPPEHFISAAEDREMAAAIAIQSMARSHVARREVKRRKTTIRKKHHEQAMEEARKLRELSRKEFLAKSDDERESLCRREMLEEEMEQIRHGDLFWGIDKHDMEVVRQLMEEKLLADAEAFWQRVNMTLRLRVEMEMHRSQEEEAQRRDMEVVVEANELDRMRAAEADQCQGGDCFWGIQAQEKREARAREDMAVEEERSRSFGAKAFIEDQMRDWEHERERRIEDDKVNKVVNEKKYQRQYFKWFYHKCETADDMLGYLWPTNQRYEHNIDDFDNQENQGEDENQPQEQEPTVPTKPLVPPYILDDTVVRNRLETEYRYGNKSIFTIHDPSQARILGRRGQYVFNYVDTDSVYAKAFKQADTKPRPTSPTKPMPASSKPVPNDTEADEEERIRYGMFPALHHRQLQGPDPHLPARYNGVPYRPSELSPTRDILMGNHMRNTQLPSLTVPSHHKSLKVKQSSLPSPQAKSKAPKSKHSSLFLAMQASNNNTVDPLSSSLGFASPFYREAQAARLRKTQARQETQEERQVRDAQEQAQRIRRKHAARFEKEELAAVRDVFLAMDLDGSGTINKTEMVWAMQRDGEVHSLARKSALLRLLLKQKSHFEELFKHLRMSDTQRDEISWDVFRIFCEEMYITLMQQGILDVAVRQPEKKEKRTPAVQSPRSPHSRITRKNSVYVQKKEEQLIRRVFALCDQDGNGVLEIDELQQALYTHAHPELQQLVRNSKALQPLLHQDMFITAFRKFEPLDPRGISEEEFVVFCLEIADLAMLNGML